jgi:type IV pilus assembly protein PilC
MTGQPSRVSVRDRPFPILAWACWKLVRMAGPGRAATDWTIVHLPIFGNLVRKTTVARFTRTLGTLISAGVPILEAVKITGETSGNYVLSRRS